MMEPLIAGDVAQGFSPQSDTHMYVLPLYTGT
jgi:hypothetical protein